MVNTFRVTRKWADQVEIGDVLPLVAGEKQEIFGEAEVVDVKVGKWNEVKGLAPDNHQFLGFGPAEAEVMLLNELHRLYPQFDEATNLITVIYLRRTK